jgi:molybdenum cofactor cytidylyltransferase
VVCAVYDGHAGVPALFPRTFFADLMALDGDSGAKAMLQSLNDKVTVPMPEAAIDIDTIEDLESL